MDPSSTEPESNAPRSGDGFVILIGLGVIGALLLCVLLGLLLAWIIPLILVLLLGLGALALLLWQVSRPGGSFRDLALGLGATFWLIGRSGWRAARRAAGTAEPTPPEQAFQDPLTTLPNRALLLDRMERALARTARSGRRVAVLFLDLDNFKSVNDTFGHSAGDHLLITVAAVLQSMLRASDTAARFGGDEFVVLLEDISQPSDAVHVAERVAVALAVPFIFGDQEIAVSASIGIAFSGSPSDRPTDLLHNADIAMYRAKRNGKARHEIFDPSMNREAQERLERERELRRALDHGELVVYYQPSVRLDDGEIVGVEALVRWQHPTRGLLTPEAFIPLAEATGQISQIDRWVLLEACRQARAWQYRGAAPMMSVNLSARQFRQRQVVDEIGTVLREVGLNPSQLALEIPERVLMEEPERSIETCRALKRLGVPIVIDDFGTAFSSARFLKRLAVDSLKIDRSFMAGLGIDPEVTVVVSAMVTLAHSLGLKVLAEGVETAAQASWLTELQCDLAQGYYFAKPSAGRMTGLLFADEIDIPLG